MRQQIVNELMKVIDPFVFSPSVAKMVDKDLAERHAKQLLDKLFADPIFNDQENVSQ